MPHRVMWVHGIGAHQPGYSRSWQDAFNPHLNLQPSDFLEVCWNTVFDKTAGATRSAEGGEAVALTEAEQIAADQVREELVTLLQARADALATPGSALTRGGDDVIEYDDLAYAATTRGAFDWLFKPDEYLGDFVKYLVSRSVRTAVKETVKTQLRPLAGSDVEIAIVAHSWGTVVAYDALLDLEIEQPQLRIANLITLGSPLWMVRRLLDDRSGRKPGQLRAWINIHARGDLVGAWLKPAFRNDKDFAVPSVPGAGAHSSYFVVPNEAVQRDIVARTILQP
jgi:metacaspase-1